MRLRAPQKGVGLIEVLITVLVLSTALMALAAMQTRSLQYNSSAFLRSQANIIAYDVLDRIRISTDSGADAVIVKPDVEDVINGQLPGGEGSAECNAARICIITISWTEPTANQKGDELEKTSFTYESRI